MKLSTCLLTGASLFLASHLSFAADSTSHDKLTSAEVGDLASIAVIDKNEILVSVVASNKKVPSDVTDLANMMINQHGNNLTQILEMVNAEHLSDLKGGDAEKLAKEGKKELMALGALQGDQFATAYVDAMVKGHQAALDLIDQHLMKNAKSETMKKFLTDTRAVVAMHLEDSKKLQEKMKD